MLFILHIQTCKHSHTLTNNNLTHIPLSDINIQYIQTFFPLLSKLTHAHTHHAHTHTCTHSYTHDLLILEAEEVTEVLESRAEQLQQLQQQLQLLQRLKEINKTSFQDWESRFSGKKKLFFLRRKTSAAAEFDEKQNFGWTRAKLKVWFRSCNPHLLSFDRVKYQLFCSKMLKTSTTDDDDVDD